MGEAYIVAAARTASGRRGGRLSGWHPVDLGAQVLNALLDRSGADPDLIEDVITGCVSQVGEQSANIARGMVLASNLPQHVPGTTIDRQCGSSQQALHFAAQAVQSGAMDIVIASGVESMSRVPMGLPGTLAEKNGFGSSRSPLIRKRFAVDDFSQFVGAEMIARKHDISKDELDAFALLSHQRASAAIKGGLFEREILQVEVRLADGSTPGELHQADEGVRHDSSLEAIRNVKLLQQGGRLTAATSSQIADGASGVMVVNERGLKTLGIQPLARIHHMTVVADDPVIMLEAPLPGTIKALKKTGLKIHDIDLFEVNEAFASVPIAWLRHVDADPARLNVHGGAIALGHPLGASGMRLMTTLVHALQRYGKRYGLQTMCEGGGMANVTIVERL